MVVFCCILEIIVLFGIDFDLYYICRIRKLDLLFRIEFIFGKGDVFLGRLARDCLDVRILERFLGDGRILLFWDDYYKNSGCVRSLYNKKYSIKNKFKMCYLFFFNNVNYLINWIYIIIL